MLIFRRLIDRASICSTRSLAFLSSSPTVVGAQQQLVLECSFSSSSAPRARARVHLVLVLVLERSFFRVLERTRTCSLKPVFILVCMREQCLHFRPLVDTASFCSTRSLAFLRSSPTVVGAQQQLVLECSFSSSSAPRARARVHLVLVLVLERSFFRVLERTRTCSLKPVFILVCMREQCLHFRPLVDTASFCSTRSLAPTVAGAQ